LYNLVTTLGVALASAASLSLVQESQKLAAKIAERVTYAQDLAETLSQRRG
jgi:hypothetical protein